MEYKTEWSKTEAVRLKGSHIMSTLQYIQRQHQWIVIAPCCLRFSLRIKWQISSVEAPRFSYWKTLTELLRLHDVYQNTHTHARTVITSNKQNKTAALSNYCESVCWLSAAQTKPNIDTEEEWALQTLEEICLSDRQLALWMMDDNDYFSVHERCCCFTVHFSRSTHKKWGITREALKKASSAIRYTSCDKRANERACFIRLYV